MDHQTPVRLSWTTVVDQEAPGLVGYIAEFPGGHNTWALYVDGRQDTGPEASGSLGRSGYGKAVSEVRKQLRNHTYLTRKES